MKPLEVLQEKVTDFMEHENPYNYTPALFNSTSQWSQTNQKDMSYLHVVD